MASRSERCLPELRSVLRRALDAVFGRRLPALQNYANAANKKTIKTTDYVQTTNPVR